MEKQNLTATVNFNANLDLKLSVIKKNAQWVKNHGKVNFINLTKDHWKFMEIGSLNFAFPYLS